MLPNFKFTRDTRITRVQGINNEPESAEPLRIRTKSNTVYTRCAERRRKLLFIPRALGTRSANITRSLKIPGGRLRA